MTFPNPAERADWYAGNHEATHVADVLYGTGHRPGVTIVGAGWAPVCGCPDPKCVRAEDDSRRIHATWDGAWHAAVQNLTDNEHGDAA